MPLNRSLADRLHRRIYMCPISGCWLWTGAVNPGGYGHMTYNGAALLAHRAMWLVELGPIPNGLSVLHKCDVPCCVNPNHLFLGDYVDNAVDMIAKGRHRYIAHMGEANGNAKVTETMVRQIRAQYSSGKTSQHKLARAFQTTRSTIAKIVKCESWRHI